MGSSEQNRERAGQLLRALQAAAPGDCDQVQDQLGELVEAERLGVDVDGDPRFAALLLHLDGCPDCLDLYSALTLELDAIEGKVALPEEAPAAAKLALPEGAPPVSAAAPAPTAEAMSVVRRSEQLVLRLLSTARDGFSLTLLAPRRPLLGTLSGGAQVSLFSSVIPELESAPLVAVAVDPGDQPRLLVVVRGQADPAPWSIHLRLRDVVAEATTDAQGVARFPAIPRELLYADDALELTCRRAPA